MTDARTSVVLPQTVSRRKTLIALGGVGAVCAGTGVWWQSTHPTEQASTDPMAAFWASELIAPNGQSLNLASLKGKPLVLNFWATWCPPCVEELPLLERFYLENRSKGWQVLAIAADQAKNVNEFLLKMRLSFLIGMAGIEAINLSKQLGNLTGGLPYTVVLAPSGQVAQRRIGQVTPAELASWVNIR